MVASLLVSLLVSTSLWSLQAEAGHISPYKCDQISVNAYLYGSRYAVDEKACFKKCKPKGVCNFFMFDKTKQEGENCHLYTKNSSLAAPVMYPANQKLCTRKNQNVRVPTTPEGSCGQTHLVGSPIQIPTYPTNGSVIPFDKITNSTNATMVWSTVEPNAAECMDVCRLVDGCTHALFAPNCGQTDGQCRLIKQDNSGKAVLFYPKESACSRAEADKKAEEEQEDPTLLCDQWAFNATKISATKATSKKNCQDKCEEFGKCDFSKFIGEVEKGINCFFYNSKKQSDVPVLYKAGEQLCTRSTCSALAPRVPVGGCSQIKMTGSIINGTEFPSYSARECMEACKNETECTHALFRTVIRSKAGVCRLFKREPEGEEIKYYPNESACTKFECGQWESTAKYLETVSAKTEEECARQCVGQCDSFVLDPSQEEYNCALYDSKTKTDINLGYNIGTRMCSVSSYIGIEPPTLPDACPVFEITGSTLYSIKNEIKTVAACTDRCNKERRCTHSGFNVFLNGTSVCYIFRQSHIGAPQAFFPKESFCPRTVGSADVYPRMNPGHGPRCGAWEFYGTYLGNVTVRNEHECQQKCAADENGCDVYMFDRRSGVTENNCFLYDSTTRGPEDVRFYPGNVLCSTVIDADTVPLPARGCSPRRLFGRFLNANVTSETSAANCMAHCTKIEKCTHAVFYEPSNWCYPFQETRPIARVPTLPSDPEDTKEMTVYAGESVCPRYQGQVGCANA